MGYNPSACKGIATMQTKPTIAILEVYPLSITSINDIIIVHRHYLRLRNIYLSYQRTYVSTLSINSINGVHNLHTQS